MSDLAKREAWNRFILRGLRYLSPEAQRWALAKVAHNQGLISEQMENSHE